MFAFQSMERRDILVEESVSCYHCGERCDQVTIRVTDKHFCCEGCKTVYHILADNNLCNYYELNQAAGISFKRRSEERYGYLDEEGVEDRLIDFKDQERTVVHFYLPQIHCSSCLWLLENLPRLEPAIRSSRVNFLKKEVHIQYTTGEIRLRQVVELLSTLGYAPVLQLNKLDEDRTQAVDKSLYYKLGLAGFAFGNIMLLSFPEYLGLDPSVDGAFVRFFGYLNIVLILPVVLYSAQDYLRSAWHGIRQKHLNIDVPVSLGILALLGRSIYEILTHTGAGYLDSLAGLIFFLLVGKWFQQKTFHKISFDRDYKSYFPMATHLLIKGKEKPVTIDRLQQGDRIVIRQGELIPADTILMQGEASIDYSFVTGESVLTPKMPGNKIFAGGRQMGGIIHLEVLQPVNQSYLTSLWNDTAFSKSTGQGVASELADKVATYFTIVILLIAASTFLYWVPRDLHVAINAVTAVLIIACPCAVALSIPFTFGNVLRILGDRGFYLKNTAVIETASKIDRVVYDKTGTITTGNHQEITYDGVPLSDEAKSWLRSLAHQSAHPMSRQLEGFLSSFPLLEVSSFSAHIGEGILGMVDDHRIEIGSAKYFNQWYVTKHLQPGTYVAIDRRIQGHFTSTPQFREGLEKVVTELAKGMESSVLTGDDNHQEKALRVLFDDSDDLRFSQSPEDKLQYVSERQHSAEKIMMIGDGLNDAGALKQSNLGIVITEHISNFVPACDAILDARKFTLLPAFLGYLKKSIYLVYCAYGIALIYNVIGLSYAVQGLLSPVIAAILMPLSSVTIVLFGIGSSSLLAHRVLDKSKSDV